MELPCPVIPLTNTRLWNERRWFPTSLSKCKVQPCILKPRSYLYWYYDNWRIIPLTVNTPWNPGEVNISVSTSSKLNIEQVTYHYVCALDRIPRCNKSESCDENCRCGWDISILVPGASFARQMVSTVRMTTANRNNDEIQLACVDAEDRHSQVSSRVVARKFRCGFETAQQTTTTQRGVRHAVHPLHQRYRIDHLNLHKRRLLFSKVKSLSDYTCAQLITNGSFTRVHPPAMESKASANVSTVLQEYIDDVGIPNLFCVISHPIRQLRIQEWCRLYAMHISSCVMQSKDAASHRITALKWKLGRSRPSRRHAFDQIKCKLDCGTMA